MIWLKSIGNFEYAVIGIFIFLYICYFTRMFLIAKKVKSSFRRVFYKFFLRTAYFSLILISFLGPSFGDIKKEVKVVSKDIFLALDLSQSMKAYDVAPSRLEKSKHEIKYMVDKLKSDRLGLIVFSSEAFLQCPLTYDINAVNLFTETSNPEMLNNSGTDLSAPIDLALEKFTQNYTSNHLGNVPKILVLFSDGEDYGDKTLSLAQKLKEKNIIVFTVGVGTSKGSKIPVPFGFKKDKNNNVVRTYLESKSLQDIAEYTGGKFFLLTNENNHIDQLLHDINKIEGKVLDIQKLDVSANKYFYFLLIGLILILIDILFTVKTVKI